MKKIIKTITFILFFFIMSKNCYAIDIIQGNEIKDMKIELKATNIKEIREIYQIINQSNSEHLYNLTLDNINYFNSYDDYDYLGGMNPYNKELATKISVITYFGYGYKKRTDIKWYGLTQYLIWKELIEEVNGEIYIVDSNNNKTDLYQKEINELLEDINHFYKHSSFLEDDEIQSEYKIKLKDTLIFEDKNNIINEYKITLSSNDLTYKIENNKLIVNPINPNLVNIYLERKQEELEYMKIYTNSTEQKLINRGKIAPSTKVLTINIEFPKIKLKESNIDNKFLVNNHIYNVYNENGDIFLSNIRLDKNGISDEHILPSGKYYIMQEKASYGYKLNNERIYFELKDEDLVIALKSELETKNITIEKQIIKNDKEIILGKNTSLNIYDEKDNLIKSITTNDKGQACIKLSFGKYKIRENSNARNQEETILIVDENFNESTTIILKEEISEIEKEESTNQASKGNIILKKYDFLTGAALPDIKIALFNKDKELIKEDITDINGSIIFKDLETGTYYIKEILKEDDYNLKDGIKVEVKEGINSIITSSNRTKIDVPDTISKNINQNIFIFLIFIVGISYKVKQIYVKKAKI